MLKLVTEAQGVELSRIILDWVLLDTVCEVADAIAALVPAGSSVVIFRGHSLRVNRHLHAKVKETVGFREVHNVELDRTPFTRVFDLEKEPLRMSARVDIILHQQVVLGV